MPLFSFNFWLVFVGIGLLSSTTAVTGTYAYLRKRSLAGDAVAHAILPGICVSFLLTGEKNPIYLLIGAFVAGAFSVFAMELIIAKTRLKPDAAIAIILSVFFGAGIWMLTYIQQTGNASQAGLDKFLFGSAAALGSDDLWVFGGTSVLVLVGTKVLFRSFFLVSFDQDYAGVIGYPVKVIKLVLSTFTVLSIITGIQAVGVVLVAALLITPAAAARFWTNSIGKMLFLAVGLAILASGTGVIVSALYSGMPTGPWIVLIVSLFALLSFLLAPEKGVVANMMRQGAYNKKVIDENVLKEFFRINSQKPNALKINSSAWVELTEINSRRGFAGGVLEKSLKRLMDKGLVKTENEKFALSETGEAEANRIVRLHRLWELYLAKKLGLPADHVHDDADSMEHLITPEMEAKLMKLLENPVIGIHGEEIPT